MIQASEIAFLPDRLNSEPVVFRGLTSVELALLAAGAIAFWLPLCLVAAGLAGYFMMGFGLAALLALGTVWIGSAWVQGIKRGKPDGYHVLRLALLLHDLRLRRSPFIRYSGLWDIRRSFRSRD
jgi:conjugative transfer region protein (TIGR03750 family)